jgi:Tfp pilus assembly protein PilF
MWEKTFPMASFNRIFVAVPLLMLWIPAPRLPLSQTQIPAADQISKTNPAPIGKEMEEAFREATRQHKEGNLESAARLYQQILYHRPNLAEVHNNLGLIYQAIGQTELAQKEYQEAVRLIPDYAVALNNLAGLYFAQGQYESASEIWFKAARKDPFDSEYCFNLGLCYHKMSAPEKALRYLRVAVKLNPQRAGAFLLLGQLHFQRGEYAASLEAYERYLPLSDKENDAQRLEVERQIQTLKTILGVRPAELPRTTVPASAASPLQPAVKSLPPKKKFFLHPARLKQFVLSIFSRSPKDQTINAGESRPLSAPKPSLDHEVSAPPETHS